MNLLLSFLLTTSPAPVSPPPHALHDAESQAAPARVDGRWSVRLDGRDLRFETALQIETLPGGKVDAAALGPLGPFRLVFTDGRLVGDKLTLKARTNYGPASFSGVVSGDTITGKWDLTAKRILFMSFGTKGNLYGQRMESAPSAPRVEVFDTVWQAVNDTFYDPRFEGVNWQSVRARFRPQAQAARTEARLVNVIRDMLATLRSSHLDFFSTAAVPPGALMEAMGGTAGDSLRWMKLSPSVGYMKIPSFMETGPQAIARVDQAFTELNSLPSLVIDLRGNPGGTLDIAARLADYLFPAPRPIGYFATRAGLAKQGARSIDELNLASLPTYTGNDSLGFQRQLEQSGALTLVAGGKATAPYRGRAVVLIDEQCGSTTEAVAAAAKESRVATLIGRRTAGAMLGADVVSIQGGWVLQLPVLDYRTARRAKIEGRGVTPDIEVKRKKGRGDADIERALRFLGSNSPGRL